MNEHSSVQSIGGPRWPVVLFILLGLNAVVQVVLRVSISDSLGLDEAEQLFLSQWLVLGYGPQPPLYNWIQQGFFALIPSPVLALSLFKHLLFLGLFALMYKTTRMLVTPAAGAVLAVAMLFLMPEFSFEAQRDLTHTVLAAFSGMWFFYALIRILLKANGAKDFILFGLALSSCLLSKYNTLLLVVPMLAVAAGIGELRRRFWVPRAGLALLVMAVLCAPHWYWLFQHLGDATANSIDKLDLTEDGSAIGIRIEGLKNMAGSISGIAGALLATAAIVFWRSSPRKPALSGPEQMLGKLFRRYLIVLLCVMLGFVAFGIGDFKGRWLLPSLVFLPAVLCFYLFRCRKVTQRQLRLFLAISLVVGLAIPVALGVRVAAARPGNYKRLNEPYRELVEQFPVTGDFLLITDRVRVAGNLMHHLPGNVVALSADMDYFPVAPRTHQTVVLAWREKHAGRNAGPRQVPGRLLAFAKEQTGLETIEFEGVAMLYAPYKYGTELRALNLAWFRVN